jgi:hypothetical protein
MPVAPGYPESSGGLFGFLIKSRVSLEFAKPKTSICCPRAILRVSETLSGFMIKARVSLAFEKPKTSICCQA